MGLGSQASYHAENLLTNFSEHIMTIDAKIISGITSISRNAAIADKTLLTISERAVKQAYNDNIEGANYILRNVPNRFLPAVLSFFNKFGLDVANVKGLKSVIGVKDKSAQRDAIEGMKKVLTLGLASVKSEEDTIKAFDKKAAKQQEYMEKTTAKERAVDAVRKLIAQAQKANDTELVNVLSNFIN